MGRALARADLALLVLARTRGHTSGRDRRAARFSRLGEHGLVWLGLGTVAALVDPPRRREWRHATGTVLGAYALNTSLKLVVRRSRPRLPGLPALVGTPTGLSFPSSHATTSFAATSAFARVGAPRAPLLVLAAGLALSRVYLGVHYPSDVLAGALLGDLLGRAVPLERR